MPPLPGNFDEETQKLFASLQRRRKDIVDFQIPRLQSCTGPLSLQQSLAEELRDDIETFSRLIEELDVCVADQKGEKNRRQLKAIVDEYISLLSKVRRDSRAALLTSKRTIDLQHKSKRDELLSSGVPTEKQNSIEKVTDDALMKANDDVTDALRRTIALMQAELERSVLSSQMLDESTATLRSTSTQHDVLSSVMFTSKQLITALEKSDWLDRFLIVSAFLFFVLVVLFILKQRFVDRGLRLALWWTRYLPDFGSDQELLNMGADGASSNSITQDVGSLFATLSSTTGSLASLTGSTGVLPLEAVTTSSSMIQNSEATTPTPFSVAVSNNSSAHDYNETATSEARYTSSDTASLTERTPEPISHVEL